MVYINVNQGTKGMHAQRFQHGLKRWLPVHN